MGGFPAAGWASDDPGLGARASTWNPNAVPRRSWGPQGPYTYNIACLGFLIIYACQKSLRNRENRLYEQITFIKHLSFICTLGETLASGPSGQRTNKRLLKNVVFCFRFSMLLLRPPEIASTFGSTNF